MDDTTYNIHLLFTDGKLRQDGVERARTTSPRPIPAWPTHRGLFLSTPILCQPVLLPSLGPLCACAPHPLQRSPCPATSVPPCPGYQRVRDSIFSRRLCVVCPVPTLPPPRPPAPLTPHPLEASPFPPQPPWVLRVRTLAAATRTGWRYCARGCGMSRCTTYPSLVRAGPHSQGWRAQQLPCAPLYLLPHDGEGTKPGHHTWAWTRGGLDKATGLGSASASPRLSWVWARRGPSDVPRLSLTSVSPWTSSSAALSLSEWSLSGWLEAPVKVTQTSGPRGQRWK